MTVVAGKSIRKVVDFAVKAHAGQVRKGTGLPYIVHPMAVMAMVAEWGVTDKVTWKAALCHDIPEECPDITHEQLVQVIGTNAADAVYELTFAPDPNCTSTVAEQKEKYMESFSTKSVRALVIKVADRCLNTADFHNTQPQYAPKYWKKAETLMATVLGRDKAIIGKYGDDVFTNMKYTRSKINRLFL